MNLFKKIIKFFFPEIHRIPGKLDNFIIVLISTAHNVLFYKEFFFVELRK